MFDDWRKDDQRSDDILDVDAVAEMLRCESTTVEERTRTGDLPGLKFGRSWVFPRAALLRRLAEIALEEAAARKSPGKKPTAAAPAPPGVSSFQFPGPVPRGRRARPAPALPTYPGA